MRGFLLTTQKKRALAEKKSSQLTTPAFFVKGTAFYEPMNSKIFVDAPSFFDKKESFLQLDLIVILTL
jgi:hypothetical protein